MPVDLTAFNAAVKAAGQPPPPKREASRPVDVSAFNAAAGAPPPESEGSGWDYVGAVAKGVAHVVGIPTEVPRTPGEMLDAASVFVPNIYGIVKQGYQMVKGGVEAVRGVKEAKTVPRKIQAGARGVPMVGGLADVAEPALTYSEGQAPTHKQNVQAVEHGTTLAAVGAGAFLGVRAGRSGARAAAVREATAARAGAVAAEEAAPILSPSQIERLAEGAQLGSVSKGQVPIKMQEAIAAGELGTTIDSASVSKWIAKHPEVASEVRAMYDVHASPEAAGAARSAEVTAPQAVPKIAEGAAEDAGAAGFDAKAYVAEQVRKREAARTAGQKPSLVSEIKVKLVDANAPIEDLLAKTVREQGIELLPSRDITNAIDRVYRAPSIAGQFARDHGIEDVIREVPDIEMFDQYLIAKHAQAIEATGRKTGRNLAEDAKLIESVKETYEPFAAKVSAYSRKLLDYATESGLISEELATKLKADYPDYVPLQRVFSEIENVGREGGSNAVASLSSQTIVRKLKGSEREIESPVESMLAKTSDAFVQGEKNKAAKILASYRELPGNPFEIEELAGTRPAGAYTFSYLDAGVKRTFTTTKEIAEAAKSLDVQRLGLVGRILSTPVRVARVGITGINPAFLASNVVRDQLTAFVNSARGVGTLANPNTFGRALFEAVGHGQIYDEIMREGAMGTSFDMARNQIPKTVASLRSQGRGFGTRAAYMARNPSEVLRAAEDLLARGEEFTRIQQYVSTKAKALADGLPEAEARIAAARAARETTVNFARRGEWGTVLNATFLYLNANIQGTRTLLRSLQARPVATSAKIATAVFLPVAMVTAWNMKDPERRSVYEDVADFEKENNIVIVPPNPTQDERGRYRVIKIPLSQEVNNLAKVPRRVIEQAFGMDDVRAGEIAEALIGTVSPVGTSKGQVSSTLVPQGAKVPVELMQNRNFFTGRDIVPEDERARDAKEERTGGTARVIARQLGVSPLQVEEAVRETFGGTGTQALNAADWSAVLLGGKQDFPIGGESSIEAVHRRFGLAFGGEVRRRERAKAIREAQQKP